MRRRAADLYARLLGRHSRYLRFPDSCIVPTRFGCRLVDVCGMMDSPGALPLREPPGEPEAVFEVGGFEDTAGRRQVVLIRSGPNALPMLGILDRRAFSADGTSPHDTLLRPFDIVLVPKSGTAKLNLFTSQYVEQVVRFSQNLSDVLGDAGR